MTDKPIELSIEVPAQTKRAIERAATERGLSVSEFLEEAVRPPSPTPSRYGLFTLVALPARMT